MSMVAETHVGAVHRASPPGLFKMVAEIRHTACRHSQPFRQIATCHGNFGLFGERTY
jgi:hypothetical protein